MEEPPVQFDDPEVVGPVQPTHLRIIKLSQKFIGHFEGHSTSRRWQYLTFWSF